MAGAMRKMAVYLGLVEDDRYDEFDEFADDVEDADDSAAGPTAYADDRVAQPAARDGNDRAHAPASGRRAADRGEAATSDVGRITTLCPRTYNEARTIGEHFRHGTPVIMNLTEMLDNDAKRLVDFAAGLVFGLRGSIERVTNKVFLLSPANVEVTAEDKARIAEGGFFNQS